MMKRNIWAPAIPVLLYSAAAAAQIEEVVVTATKRGETTAQDLAMSISALSGAELDQRNSVDFADVAFLVPNLHFEEQGAGKKRYVIRGIHGTGEPLVALYYDDIPVTGSAAGVQGAGATQPDVRIVDVDRIEVLRGPQGTLYGNSSMGGTVRYFTRKPELSEWSGYAQGGVSDTRYGGTNFDSELLLNAPLVPKKFGLRGVAYYSSAEGFIDVPNVGLNDQNDSFAKGGRLSSLWAVSDSVTLSTNSYFQDAERDGRNVLAYPPRSHDDLSSGRYSPEPFDDELQMHNVKLEWALANGGTFTSTTSYFDREIVDVYDVVEELQAFTGLPLTGVNYQFNDTSVFSQEFLFSSKLGDATQLVLGAYYENRDGDNTSVITLTDGATGLPVEEVTRGPPIDPTSRVFWAVNGNTLEQKAIFGEISYDFSDAWTGVVGARWFNTQTESEGETIASPFGTGAEPDREADESRVTPKLSLEYRASDTVTLYGTISEGFRAGGTNRLVLVGNIQRAYDSDSLRNYELGMKTSWRDGTVLLNGAVFHLDWQDMQVQAVDPAAPAFVFITNAGEAQVDGLELELAARPTEKLNLSLGVGYLNSELTEDQPSLTAGGRAEGKKGDPIPYTTPWTLSASAYYTQPISWLDDAMGSVGLDFSYRDTTQTDFNRQSAFYFKLPNYELVNLNASIDSRSGKWRAFFYVRNLTDKRAYVNIRAETNVTAAEVFINTPRTIGAGLRFSF